MMRSRSCAPGRPATGSCWKMIFRRLTAEIARCGELGHWIVAILPIESMGYVDELGCWAKYRVRFVTEAIVRRVSSNPEGVSENFRTAHWTDGSYRPLTRERTCQVCFGRG